MVKPIIRVVAALIEQQGRYLITQRAPTASLPLLWEFPGGRVEMGESDERALVRELLEDMEIDIEVKDKVFEVTKEYERYVIEFATYECRMLHSYIRPIKVYDYRFVSRAEFADYEFPGADQETIDLLMREK